MRAGARAEVNNDARDVLGPTQPPHRVALGVLLDAARHLEQAVGHLGREEAGADAVHRDMAGSQLDGQVAAQVDHGRLGGRVAVRGLLAQRSNAQARDRGRNQDPAGILDGRALLE